MALSRSQLPLAPVVRSFLALPTASPSVRDLAIRSARTQFLHDPFLDRASDDEFGQAIEKFYRATVEPALLVEHLRRRIRFVRHGIQHILHGGDSFATKLDHCLNVEGPYTIVGLGRPFWGAIVKAIDPDNLPLWSSTIEQGLKRLGLWRKTGHPFARCEDAYRRLRQFSTLDAFQWDALLPRVAMMTGRELRRAIPAPSLWSLVPDLVRRERIRIPVKRRLRDRNAELDAAKEQFLRGEEAEALKIFNLSPFDPALINEVRSMGHSDDAFDTIASVNSALPAAVLHLRDRAAFPLWDEASRSGMAALVPGIEAASRPSERYRLHREAVAELMKSLRLHPLEVAPLLQAIADLASHTPFVLHETESSQFGGFCDDTFHFLKDLAANNEREWMQQERERYHYAIREPLRELSTALVERYVEPILRREHGWDIEISPRTGRVLSSICKNDYGRTTPYQPEMWITFYRRNEAGKRGAVQFFVRLDACGLRYGLHLGRTARESSRQFRRNVQEYGESLFRSLKASGAMECAFVADGVVHGMKSVVDLRSWATGKTLEIVRSQVPDSPLMFTEELVGDILMTFDRLLSAYACAVEEDPLPFLQKRSVGERFDDSDFRRMTHLHGAWLPRARELLTLKKQLILQGVPGTGKTHVARSLARQLTNDRPDAVRLVQFHPAYSYEEFVEGIRSRSVEMNGRQEVTYPVEDGLFVRFANEAAQQPELPFVLIIDEINRGNLPRIFGELLYLLEYRDQAILLPYSRREFKLPGNLVLIGTMNSADRSTALLDQALRRRFSFLEMPPDAAILSEWLRAHPPRDGESFADRVVQLFEGLNRRLSEDLGASFQVGHSYFMVPDLDESVLGAVWEHQVRPLVQEYFTLQPSRANRFEFDELWNGGKRRNGSRMSAE